MPPSVEEFARWRDDSVTRWFFHAFSTIADENKALWLKASWDNGQCNPLLLKELRTRADAYMAVTDTTYEALCETNGDEAIYDTD